MYGINGIIHNNKKEKGLLKSELAEMNQVIYPHGPQDNSYNKQNAISTFIAMVLGRLADIILNTGKQPLHTSDNNLAIVLNGEPKCGASLRFRTGI